jgi:hypothetical protein
LAPDLRVGGSLLDTLTWPDAAKHQAHWTVGTAGQCPDENVGNSLDRRTRVVGLSYHRHSQYTPPVAVDHEGDVLGIRTFGLDGAKDIERVLGAEQEAGQDIRGRTTAAGGAHRLLLITGELSARGKR